MIEWLAFIATIILFAVVLRQEIKALTPKKEEEPEGGEEENEFT